MQLQKTNQLYLKMKGQEELCKRHEETLVNNRQIHSCLCFFPVAVIKYSCESNFRGKEFILVHTVHDIVNHKREVKGAGALKSWSHHPQQDAGVLNASAAQFCFSTQLVWDPRLRMVSSTVGSS